MEDFRTAFSQRCMDVEALHEKQRYVASMHIGGVAVECLLKAIICDDLPDNAQGKKEWYDKEKRNNPGHTVCNPGHDYGRALRSHNDLYWFVTRKHPYVLQWLDKVESPECHFINMRYVGQEPDERRYQSWYDAYQKLVGWLTTQDLRRHREEENK